ncbi:MAG TPA: prolyl oligopeptidase family serine peptidase [Acidobacteriota bacterium]|nr:prolyl oligopeptidase family serine peptidase [Acidobacteriota bacterium]
MLALVLAALLVAPAAAQSEVQPQYADQYLEPPQEVSDILDRDRHYDELDWMSPDGNHFLIPVEAYFSSLERMSRKTYRLAMLELNPEVNREWSLTTHGIKGLRVFSLAERSFHEIDVPEGALISDVTFSPDGSRIAFLAHLDQATQIWTANVADGSAQSLSDRPVMATLAARPQWRRAASAPSRMIQWTPDGGLLTLLVPSDRGPEPQAPGIPDGPLIRRTRKKPTPTPTYPFLLRTENDKDLFRYYTTAQLALLRPGQEPREIGDPQMYWEMSLSPDGRHILAEYVVDPLSFITSYNDFPRNLVVMDLQGQILNTVREKPLTEAMTRGDDRGPEYDLPREVAWRPDGQGLSLLWREPKKDDEEDGDSDDGEEQSAQDEEAEEPDDDQPRLDRLMQLTEPYDPAQAKLLASSEWSFSDAAYSEDGQWAFAQMSGRNDAGKSRRRISAFNLSAEEIEEKVLVKDWDQSDPLKRPGELMTRRTGNGVTRALTASDGGSVYLEGEGLREDLRPRPFIDRVTLADASTTRLFQGAEDAFEEPLAVLDDDLNRIVISRESPTDFPDSFLRASDGGLDQLTDNQDPFPEFADNRWIPFEFERRDGLKMRGRIALPLGYQQGTRVPAVFWTYPRESGSRKEYERATIERYNLNEFSHLNYRNASEIWLTQGYAVVEPDIPIIGKGRAYNDNYVAHLVDSMHAAIREVDRMGYIDVDRLGHGGHSYGAFATANILAHSPFFKAGIAGDGAYNRTLTPMSFQRERRFIWDATHLYLEMSPFFQADHIDTPMLMYHGAQDDNTGTFLIQSERMIQALTGLGKTAVLYIYPFESHGPRARATYDDLWARWLQWFDTHVKNEGKETDEEPSETSG